MKLKFKLNLQQFGNADNFADELDGTNDDFINITWKGINYKLPENILQNVGAGFGEASDNDGYNAVQYLKYYIDKNGRVGGVTDFKSWANENNITLKGTINTSLYEAFTGPITERFTREQGSIGLTPATDTTGQVDAFNQYYRDIYSLEPGTGGAEMLNRLEQSYMNQAQQAATMADVSFQQAAMQQAQTVKQITDQVRSERLARLRAGMSESQIANQDMQMLMTNVNALNQNAQLLNQARLEAQIGMNTAQDQAYTDFLAQANQRGQIGSAMAASDAGDTYQQTIRQMTALYGTDPSKWTSQQWTETSNRVATGNPAGTTNK